MSLFLAKKQEDNNQKKVRDLLRLKENKKCFDCPTKSPAFVNTTIQTFICARCSGLVREVGHRVKAISASKFSGAELMALKKGGNGIALKIWLSNYSTHDAPEPESDADVRSFMKQKYYEYKWLDRTLLQSHKEEVRTLIAKSFTEDGLPIVTKSRTRMIPGFSRVPLIADSEMNIMQDDDDDNEENVESSVVQQAVVLPPVVPGFSVPQTQVTSFPMPPTSPVSRSSIDSINSYSSSSQGGSIYNYRGSQDMVRNDIYAAHNNSRQNSESLHQPVAQVLTKEQIAERCRSGIDSSKSAELYQQQDIQPVEETLPAAATHVLTAEQIAERCRSSVAYSPSVEVCKQEVVQPAPQVEAPSKTLPSLTIDTGNNSHHHSHHQQHLQHQLKSPTLVRFDNNIQSQPIHQRKHDNHVSASASFCVTPSISNPVPKPTRPSMAAPSASASAFDSILSDLAGLKLEKTVRRATYTGGMLSPAVSNAPESSKSSPLVEKNGRPASMFNADFFSQLNKMNENKNPENDPYAALRGIPAPMVATIAAVSNKSDEDRNTSSSEDDDEDEDQWQEFCSSTNEIDDGFLGPEQVIQPVHEESKPITNPISIDLFSDLDPRSMFKRF